MDLSTTEIKIMKSATAEFAEYGFAGARVERIARKAKTNKAMIYYYFRSKEKLYEAILTNTYNEILNDIIGELPADIKPDEQIELIIRKLIKVLGETDPMYLQLFLKELTNGAKYIKKIAIEPIVMPIINMVMEIFKKGKEQGRFRDMDHLYSFLPVVGTVIFFNIIRTIFKGTEVEKLLITGNYLERFADNLVTIYKYGITPNKERI